MIRMRPKYLAVFILMLVAPSILMSSTEFQAKIQVRVMVTKANIRMEPTTDSAIITAAPRGTLLDADPLSGNFYRVYLPPNASGVVVSGYIHMNLVEVVDPSPAAVQKQPGRQKKPAAKAGRQPVSPRVRMPGQGGSGSGYGIKFGMNMANWYGKDVKDADANLKSKVGLVGGGFFNMALMNNVSVQPEILYTQKGTVASALGVTLTTKADYIEVPVLFKFSLPPRSGFSPNAYVGPAAAIKIRGVGVVKSGGNKEKDTIEDLATFDLGLAIGTGAEYAPNSSGFLGSAVLLLDVRYTIGLLSISTQENVAIRNGVFSIILGLKFTK